MKLLYLTEDYLYSKVHNNLLKNMLQEDESLEVYVFSPVKMDNPHGIEDTYYVDERLKVITPKIDIALFLYKLDFWAKLRCKIRLIEKFIPLNEINLIHSGTLFSDGGAAYCLNKRHNIPYLVAIRGTDVMTYSKIMPHLWPLANRILKKASVISCITPSIKKKMQEFWQYKSSRERIKQALIINNGIDSIWIDHLRLSDGKINDPIRVIYIGRFDSNKNVLRLVKAIELLKKQYNISLTLIGGKGEEHIDVLKKVNENSSYMDYLGPIYDKEVLMSIVRKSDIFAMVSHSETFGLVYAECLSQGLPIVYTEGTGFSDIYPQGYVGYGVDSRSIESICVGIKAVITNYVDIKKNISTLDFGNFAWNEISQQYLKIYKSIIMKYFECADKNI